MSDILQLIEKLKKKSAYELLFEEKTEKSDFDALLALSESEIAQIGIKRGAFQKIHTSIQKMKQLQRQQKESSVRIRRSKYIDKNVAPDEKNENNIRGSREENIVPIVLAAHKHMVHLWNIHKMTLQEFFEHQSQRSSFMRVSLLGEFLLYRRKQPNIKFIFQ